MYTELAYQANKLELEHRLTEARRHRLPVRRETRGRRRGLLAAVVTAAALALVPAAANAQSLNDVAINTESSFGALVLDVSGASRDVGAPVIQWYNNNGANQRWNLVPNANGTEHIVNVNSQLCLATDGVPGDWIGQWPCSNNPEEDWTGTLARYFSNDETQSLRNPASGLYLDIDGGSAGAGAHLIAWYPNNSWGQFFEYTQY